MFVKSKSNARCFELNSNEFTKFEDARKIPKSYYSKF